MKQIRKFILMPQPGVQKIEVSSHTRSACCEYPYQVLDVQCQNGVISAWCLVDTESPHHDIIFHVVETGDVETLKPNARYISTIQLYNGTYVLHVFVEE